MIENEIYGNEDGDDAGASRLPHGAVHHFVPALLRQDLVHGHERLFEKRRPREWQVSRKKMKRACVIYRSLQGQIVAVSFPNSQSKQCCNEKERSISII